MATNLPNNQNYIDSLLSTSINVDAEIYNQVFSFFSSKTTSNSAAQQLTQSVLTLTYNNNLDTLKIITEFNKAANDSELKTLLIAFFNSLRPSSSKIGFGFNNQNNEWIQRNILP